MFTVKQLNESFAVSRDIDSFNLSICGKTEKIRDWEELQSKFNLPYESRVSYKNGSPSGTRILVGIGNNNIAFPLYPVELLDLSRQEIYNFLYELTLSYWKMEAQIQEQIRAFNDSTVKFKDINEESLNANI